MLKSLKEHDWVGYGFIAIAVFYAMSAPPHEVNSSQLPPAPIESTPPQTLPTPQEQLPSPLPPKPLPSPSPEQGPNPTPNPAPKPPNPSPITPGKGKTIQELYNLFANLQSPGVNAIAAAEGNRYPDGRNTPLYEGGHVDPGNGKFNRGWCSDQGRGKDNADADRKCLERVRSRMDRINNLFRQAGIDPTQHLEAWVNALDLWNQARPQVSDLFPAKYAQGLREGRQGTAAILYARVEAFRRDGEIDAAGLLRICQRSPSRAGLSPWMCVATDQARRLRMIRAALVHAKVI